MQEEQITIKDILLKIISVKNTLIKNWKTVILFAIIGALLGFLFDYKNLKDTTYTSLNKFYLETAVPANDYGGFASMLGGAAAQTSGLFSGTNLLELIRSKDFLEKTLLNEVTINGKKHILANYFHEKNKLKGDTTSKFYKYVELTHANISKYDFHEIESLEGVSLEAMLSTTLAAEDKTSFMNLEVKTFNDTLSKIYAEQFLETLKQYYIESKTGKLKTNVLNQKHIVDSLKYSLSGAENALARMNDQNREVVFEQGKIQENNMKRKSVLLSNAYQEQERMLSNLKFQLYQDSPLFKITSPQRFPIAATKTTLTKSYPKGLFIGIFLSLIFIIFRDAIKSILKEEKK